MPHADHITNKVTRTLPSNAALRLSRAISLSKAAMPVRILSCLLLSLALTACGGGNTDDLRSYVKDVKARHKGHIPPLPEVKSYETYTYNEKELRDPFQPTSKVRPTQVTTNNGIAPDLKRERQVLEQFPLDTLKMMGMLEQNGERWALIKSEDGTLYRTKKGRYIGQNNGRITRITDSAIELTEIVPDGLGGWVKRQSTLSVTQ